VKFDWIHTHRDHWPVNTMCELLGISRSGYYAWIDRPPSDRTVRQEQLLTEIRLEHARTGGASGAPKVYEALKRRKIDVCLNTVASLMRKSEIRSVRSGRYRVQTTDSSHDHAPAANLLDQDFTAGRPNQKWLCDITYVPTDEGFVYLASVMDVFSRKIVGWQMSDGLDAGLCLEALRMALQTRRPDAGLLHHSDRGVQYACDAYQCLLSEHGILCSMSRRGNCYDNAMIESFHASYKTELVYPRPRGRFRTIEEARQRTFEWIEVFYNRQRLHSAIGYLSPEAFEASLN
jgi:putative transposase